MRLFCSRPRAISGVFFSVDRFPDYVEPVTWILPMTHVIGMVRPLTAGQGLDPGALAVLTRWTERRQELGLSQKEVAERLGIVILSAFVAHTAWHWMVDRGATLREYSFSLPALDLAFAASAMRAATSASGSFL